jgi:hypothetical protein
MAFYGKQYGSSAPGPWSGIDPIMAISPHFLHVSSCFSGNQWH